MAAWHPPRHGCGNFKWLVIFLYCYLQQRTLRVQLSSGCNCSLSSVGGAITCPSWAIIHVIILQIVAIVWTCCVYFKYASSYCPSVGRNMNFRSRMYWQKIVDGSCKFDRRPTAFRGMRELLHNPRRMIDFYNTFFLNTKSRRLLAVQLYGKGKPVSTVAAPGQTVVTEAGVEAFKTKAAFYTAGIN